MVCHHVTYVRALVFFDHNVFSARSLCFLLTLEESFQGTTIHGTLGFIIGEYKGSFKVSYGSRRSSCAMHLVMIGLRS